MSKIISKTREKSNYKIVLCFVLVIFKILFGPSFKHVDLAIYNRCMADKEQKEVVVPTLDLWNLEIAELNSKSLESSGREEVNELLQKGWVLLHIYTLKYKDEVDGEVAWRERPMAILGRPKNIA